MNTGGPVSGAKLQLVTAAACYLGSDIGCPVVTGCGSGLLVAQQRLAGGIGLKNCGIMLSRAAPGTCSALLCGPQVLGHLRSLQLF